ncbi:UMP kinase [Lutibaculum baratangense]|uniref:Uridylate kinase n=1 Tax=Lutibaculum baratangense AMV1 TaxID=631454 RepID=V4RDM0_9HYPH|nr:UMP kinase [Lutibaculum baratangense]ESR23464.1 Uridylate kinase [Lutibaculum baratangense AMV1]
MTRVLLKLSGEALMGASPFGIDLPTTREYAREIAECARDGASIAIVVGGGNIFRGMAGAAKGMDRASADYMGMLATVMNSLAVAQALRDAGVAARPMSAIPMESICETYTRYRADEYLKSGEIVVLGGGTGSPFFTTDSTAALRAAELGCSAILKATQVDGVYDSDPKTNPAATRFETLTYGEVLARDLRVMDSAAIALARDSGIPIIVFDIHRDGALADVLAGRGRFTRVAG